MSGRLVEHALAYARTGGLAVFPLVPRGKRPATAHGKDDATLDLDRIAAWWRSRPDFNIGVRPNVGMVVLDEDVQHGGHEALAGLCAANGELPVTWTARTGSGGRHIWLRADPQFRGRLCQGVDLKSHTGYLVAPPSIHPNGHPYAWLNKRPIAWAPAWLRPLLAPPPVSLPPSSATGNGEGLVRFVAEATEGNRNAALYWAARRAVSEGTFGRLRGDLYDAALCAGLTGPEIESTLRSAARTNHRDAG